MTRIASQTQTTSPIAAQQHANQADIAAALPHFKSGPFPTFSGRQLPQRKSYTVIDNPQPTKASLMDAAKAGRPLQRSAAINSLAQQAISNRGRKPKSGKAWASRLASDISAPND